MSLLFIALSSFMIALSGALMPGPLLTITVGESMKRGLRAGPLIILGHGILELLAVFLLIFGIRTFLDSEGVRVVIGGVGGVILIAMGLALLRDAGRAKLVMSGDGRTGIHPVVSGVIGSISNPYWVIWWITIGTGYLMSSLKEGIPGVAAFYVGHISADFAWYTLISYAVSRGREMMGQRGYRMMLYLCGAFLIGFGGWFISTVRS